MHEEVEGQALTRNVGGFRRFIEAAAGAHASVINLSTLAHTAEIERKTAEGYLRIIQDLFLAYRLPPLRERNRRRTVGHAKLFFPDAGIAATLRAHDPLDPPRIAAGQALSGLVAMHLRAHLSSSALSETLSYWRTSTGLEVDFVVRGAAGITAIGLKRPDRMWSACFAGLVAFGDEHPEATRLLLYRGGNRFVSGGVTCLPLEEFLGDVGGRLFGGPAGTLAQEPKE